MVDRVIEISGRGARGESQADILRRTGLYGVLPTDTDAQAMAKLNAAAEAAAAEAAGYAASAYTAAKFRDTLAEAITDFAVGEYFNTKDTSVALRDDAGTLTGETNTDAIMRACKRVAASPYYEHLGPGSDPANRVEVDAKVATADLASTDVGKGISLVKESSEGLTGQEVFDLVHTQPVVKPSTAPSATAYAQLLSDLKNGIRTPITRAIPSAKHEGIIKRTNADDLSTLLQDFFDDVNTSYQACPLYAPPGKYFAQDLDLGSIDLLGDGHRRTLFSPVDNTASHVFRVSKSDGGVNGLYLLHDRSFECDGVVFEHVLGAADANAINRWARMWDVRVEGFKGAGLRAKNAVIESNFDEVYLLECGDPDNNIASWHWDQPSTNGEYHNNNYLGRINLIFPYYIGMYMGSEKDSGSETLPGHRESIIHSIFTHGFTTAIDTAPAPYDVLVFKNISDFEIQHVRGARVPNGKWLMRIEEGSAGSNARRFKVGSVFGDGVGGTQTANGIKLTGCEDVQMGMVSLNGDFTNGTDLHIDSGSIRVTRPQFKNAGGRAPNITDTSSAQSGWKGGGEYNFGGATVRGVKGLNRCENLTGRITIANPDTTGAVTFANTEPDTSYRIQLTANKAAVRVGYSAVTTGGFQVDLVRNGDTSDINVDWAILRQNT